MWRQRRLVGPVLLVVGLVATAGFGGAIAAGAAAQPWTISPTAPLGAKSSESNLNDVACVAPKFCVAVGWNYRTDGTFRSLIERWNGHAWAPRTSPSPTADSELRDVSCATTTACIAVGITRDPRGHYANLIEQWAGASWTVSPGPVPNKNGSQLNSVSCWSPTGCMAVGATGSVPNTPLAELWNGTTWTILKRARSPMSQELESVSCTSATHCVAVGFGFIETWDGAQWTAEPPGTATTTLWSLSCAGSGCVAIGDSSVDGLSHADSEVLIGSTWTAVPVPAPEGSVGAGLLDVSCLSATRCVAAGSATYRAGEDDYSFTTLIESWDGAAWTIVPSPTPDGVSGLLNGVACATNARCAAVGWDGSGLEAALALTRLRILKVRARSSPS